ncbi:uncharacterized protein LOC132888866 [Neoarius graeffei]|uniref:uncharacterized protein LOC132888866 n=1 Tax=Neoarius graeffei TaxID=443677 RepID=UPI00298C6CCE|nr:uncharacterized protein LOC132888866 [Neoarius graeffei]
MSSLEKRQANRRGSTRGPRKCSDGISDTSSVGSFMDDTDREVSSLTDRAFRSLCIGEDAIYNDLEVSSPADQHKACSKEALQKKDLRTTCQKSSSHGIPYEEAERNSEMASTFQHSYVDIAQEHVLRDESLSYISNGSMEATWQQKRSTSRVSSLIKTFSSGESYSDSWAPDTVKDKYRDFNNESWDKSALLSIQRELSEFSSGYHPNFKSGPLQSYGNNFHAVARMNTTTSSITKFKTLNNTNFFFHSEFSPFQLWKDYNKFPFGRGESSGFVSATEFPRWYDSPLYKELTATHRTSSSPAEGRQLTRRKIEDVAASQRSRSTVIQKASAIEKRCESELASNNPPWKNNNFVRNKLPSNRPNTVSPTNEKVHRPDSSLLYHSRHAYEIQHKVGKAGSSEMSSRTTPFNITQLLTPVIPGRQETETSEILQFAHTPLVSEYDSDLKPQSDAKKLCDSYKSKASSLLFNLKDNRKRVKSTYSPTKFKGSEISDRNKQPSKLEGRESRLSETSGSKATNQEHSTVSGTWELCNLVQPNYELSLFQTTEQKQYADKTHNNLTSVPQYSATNCNNPYKNNHLDQLTKRESEHYELSTNSGLGNSGGSPVGHINGSTRTFGPTRPETENIFSKAELPAHLSAEMSAKHTFCRREDGGQQNFVKRPSSGYINNQVTEENLSWKRTGPVNMVIKEMVNNNGIKDTLPYKGEIAALIEMDKQRKATAKQYLPSGNEIYTTGKETWVNKMNENVNGNWLPKDKQFVDTKNSFQTYADKHFSNTQVKDDPTNTPATSQNVYEVQHNNLQKMSFLPKDANFTRGSELTSAKHEKAEVCPPRNMRRATSDIVTEKGYSQRPQSVEEKYQYNEGSVAYQPYKYESNKQWHIATTENRHAKDRECISRQLQQTEMKAEQPGESSYVHSQSKMSCIHQQSTAYSARTSQRNSITEDRAKTEEHKPTYSIAPSQLYHKQGNMNTDLNIPNTQRTLQNNDSSQTRGDKFNINDILSVRDNEQAKRVRENKHSFNGRVGNSTKFENLTSPVISDMAEDIAAKTEPSKVQSQAQQDGNSHCKHENTNVSHGYVRKESHIPNDMRERSGKDIFISNENDKIAPRALSYKEKGQTKQEILTSKLKAHAQKEISAIKEKGLAKHVIPSRNPIKQNIAIKNETGQINQEVLSPKKEITAEKLNHLFQDITYSSVPLYKEQRNQGKAEPKYHKITAEKVELLPRDMGSEKDKAAPEKERATFQMIKLQEEKITVADKKNCEVQKFVQNYVYQPSIQSKENQLSKHNEKERSTNDSAVANGTIPAKCFSSSPTLKVLSDEESVVKKEDKTSSNLSTPYTSNNMEYSTFKANGNDSLDILVKAATNHLTLYNISGDAITLERPVNKAKEQLSKVNTDKSTVGSNTASLKCYDLQETTTSKDNTRKENPVTLPTAGQLEINTRQDKTPSDWTKDEVPSGEMEFTETETAFLNKRMANIEQEREHLQSGVGGISENQTVLPESTSESSTQVYCMPNTEPLEKETWLEKQDIQADVIQTSVTNENSFLQQLHNTDTLNSSQSISLNKAVSVKVDSSEENKYSLQQEPKIKTMHCESSEVQETVPQLKFKIRHENQNEQMIRDKEVTENTNQQLQRDSERTPDTEHHNQKAKDFHEHIETTPMEKKQSNHDIRTYSNNDSKSPGTAHEKSEEKDFMPIITINSKDPQLSTRPPQDKSADSTNPVSESHVIHIASKEDKSPADEPIIYSICISSTSEAVSEDEPIIYSISVSSSSDASMTTGPENQEKFQKQHSIEQVEKDDKETFGNKNKESVLLESKEDSKEGKLLLYNNMAEQETVVRKYDTPASKDKSDYYRSTELDNISSSYESLLAKYGLPNGDTIHLESDQKEQDKKQAEEKEESTHKSLEKIQNNTTYNDQAPVEERLTLADFTKKHSQESSKLKSPKASPELLRNTEENHGQCVTQSEQEHQTANGGGTQRADGVVHVDRNTKQDVSAKQEIMMSMDVPVCEDIVDMQSAKQIMANGNVQQNENKQVGQKVQTVERGLKENDDDDDDDVVNKNTEMVQVKCENDVKLTAGFSSDNISNKSINNSCDDSPQPSSKISTNDCQLRIKTQEAEVALGQYSQNADNQSGNTKSPVLQYRTQKECDSDAPKHEQVSKECFQTGDNKAVQNNGKELVCKSEFPELEQVKFMISNNTKVSRVIVSQKEISAFTNEQTKENSCINQSQLKYAFPAGKTDQSVCTLPDIPLEHKEVHKHDIENKTETDTVSTRAAVPLNDVSENAQNTTPAKVTGTKASSAPSMTEDNLERFENEKWKREPAQKERQIIKDEITLFNKDPRTASSVIKGDKDTECESSKSDKLKEAKSQPQDKKDDDIEKLIIDNSRKNTGRKEIKTGIGTFKESSDIIRWDTETSGKVLGDKHDQLSNVYHPQTDALPEEMGNTYDGRNMFESKQNSQYHDKVLTKKEGTVTKTEVTQREKKMTRPEISALADYARLRVISAEDDTITEKDLLQKMNTNQKYNLSAVEPQKVNFSMLVDGREQSKQLSVNKKSENLSATTTTTPLQVQEQRTYKITEEIFAGHNQCSPRHEIIASPKLGSLAKSSDDRVFAVNDTESTKEKTLTNHMQSNMKKYLPGQDYDYSRSHEVYKPRNSQATHPSQSQIESQNDPKLKQPVNANIVERKVYPQVKNAQSAPQVSIETELNNANIHADNQIQEEAKDEETTEELQYYIVNAMEDETKPKNNQEPPSLSHKITSKKDLTEIHATAPQSNTSSPAMGKAIMFKVKDNTGKTSSVTKTVRPCFHRSFSEEFRIGSPVDSCCGSEKDKVDFDHENHPKESANSPVLHEQSVTSHRLSRAKEIQARNKMLSPGFMAPKEPRNYNRRSHISEEHESRSLISTVPEGVESRAVSSVVVTDSRGFDNEHIRHTYARPESSCYERPESVCYERPESACSDMRATGKPPAVLPKTEKALRRAKRLTSRRIRKVEEKMTSDTPVQPENKSIRTVSSLPASPIVKTSAPQSVQASPPPISHYQVEPNYAPPAPSIVAHSFPMTQRKLLQDPNSGQIFMVDMPVQVKTKTFFDPETGKYLQLNVRQRTQSTLSQPASVEVLGHPYVVYPGFLPMSVSVSSLPSVRSSSQMSAPATIPDERNQLKASHEPSEQEIFGPERPRNVQQHNRPLYRTREQTGREILQSGNVRMTPRQTHIITMTELEDFAMDNR